MQLPEGEAFAWNGSKLPTARATSARPGNKSSSRSAQLSSKYTLPLVNV